MILQCRVVRVVVCGGGSGSGWERDMEILKELLGKSPAVGKVEWLGISPASRAMIQPQQSVQIVPGGIAGDHHCRPQRASKRQVTLIQAEHLAVVADLLNCGELDPELLRRNIVVSGICLESLRYQQFRIGSAILSGSGSCPPCSRMEENLGPGGYAAMLGHGGITAIVVEPGEVRVGDRVQPVGVEGAF
ncbi:MAG: MOSC domain-containing protein [Planctomyces sp.]